MRDALSLLVPLLVDVLVLAAIGLVTYALTALRRRLGEGIASDALQLLVATAGVLVAGAADEVRSLKDPLRPGSWTPAVGRQIRDRVLGDLRRLGGDALGRLRTSGGLAPADMERLLEALVESEVERMRRTRVTLNLTARSESFAEGVAAALGTPPGAKP